jgi:hypothetical protein
MRGLMFETQQQDAFTGDSVLETDPARKARIFIDDDPPDAVRGQFDVSESKQRPEQIGRKPQISEFHVCLPYWRHQMKHPLCRFDPILAEF